MFYQDNVFFSAIATGVFLFAIFLFILCVCTVPWKGFCPFLFYNFFCIFVTLKRFRSSNKLQYFTKITQVNTKCSFEIIISFIKGEKAVQTCLALHEKVIPPKSNNWLCHTLQQQLQSSVCDNWQWVFHIAVEEFWPTLCRIVLIQSLWRVFEHEWTV